MKINIEKLKEARESLWLTKIELADKTNLTRQHIEKLELDKVWITLKTMMLIVEVMNRVRLKKGLDMPILKAEDFLIYE